MYVFSSHDAPCVIWFMRRGVAVRNRGGLGAACVHCACLTCHYRRKLEKKAQNPVSCCLSVHTLSLYVLSICIRSLSAHIRYESSLSAAVPGVKRGALLGLQPALHSAGAHSATMSLPAWGLRVAGERDCSCMQAAGFGLGWSSAARRAQGEERCAARQHAQHVRAVLRARACVVPRSRERTGQ